VHGQNSVFCFTWGSVVSKKPTLDSRIVFTMIRTSDMIPCTMHTIMDVLRWSITALQNGIFPACDHRGKPFSAEYEPRRHAQAGKQIAGGYVGLWSEMRGDWKFLKEVDCDCTWVSGSPQSMPRPRVLHMAGRLSGPGNTGVCEIQTAGLCKFIRFGGSEITNSYTYMFWQH
jgi:hypothetical protein